MDLETQYEKLLRYCYMKTRDRSLAEDIVQETYLKFFQSYTYKDIGKELPYLYTVARNLCIDEFRKKSFEDISDYPNLRANIDTEPESKILQMELEEALDLLPSDLREIVLLRYMNELPVSVIAEILNMSRFSVHRRIKEGLRILRHILSEGETDDRTRT